MIPFGRGTRACENPGSFPGLRTRPRPRESLPARGTSRASDRAAREQPRRQVGDGSGRSRRREDDDGRLRGTRAATQARPRTRASTASLARRRSSASSIQRVRRPLNLHRKILAQNRPPRGVKGASEWRDSESNRRHHDFQPGRQSVAWQHLGNSRSVRCVQGGKGKDHVARTSRDCSRPMCGRINAPSGLTPPLVRIRRAGESRAEGSGPRRGPWARGRESGSSPSGTRGRVQSSSTTDKSRRRRTRMR